VEIEGVIIILLSGLDFELYNVREFRHNNNIYLLQLGCHTVAVVILHVNKT